jgi:zinc/manganese transport system permease protein
MGSIITEMFAYEFMTNAFAAAGIAAVVSGLVGYFLVMRGQTFAGHALSHIGFAGAIGAGLIGLAPLWGLVAFTTAAGVTMGALGERLSNRDVAIGVVLALALGFGLLFLIISIFITPTIRKTISLTDIPDEGNNTPFSSSLCFW